MHAREIDVVPGEVRVHGMIYVGDVVLDVDLLIECVLALLGEVRGAREGVGAVIGDGVLDPRLQDGLFGSCPGREETKVGQRGARAEGAATSGGVVERRPTTAVDFRVANENLMTSSRGGREGRGSAA